MTEKPGLLLRFLSSPSSLGWVLMAATPKGICFLHFCGNERPQRDQVEALLTRTYRGSSVVEAPADPLLLQARDALLSYLDGSRPLPRLPLDLSAGTPFEQSVWQALCRITHGSTQSYGAIAAAVGRPRATRAVGRACGKNPIAVLVPCHRVIARNGSLGGYSGGLPIKRALLAIESPSPMDRP